MLWLRPGVIGPNAGRNRTHEWHTRSFAKGSAWNNLRVRGIRDEGEPRIRVLQWLAELSEGASRARSLPMTVYENL